MEPKPLHSDFQQRVSAYTPALKAFLVQRLGSEDDAEDALQDILYNLFRTVGDDLSEITNLPAWLFRSARNMLANIARSSNRKYASDDELLDIIADCRYEQDHQLLHQLFWQKLDEALSELPEEQRSIWEMTELEGVPIKEIARLSGIKQATLLSRKHYAVKHLRIRLRNLYNEIINL